MVDIDEFLNAASVPEDYLDRIHDMFVEIDTDCDKKISKEELTNWFEDKDIPLP
jgi:Ca2+-binding EF-hand superfamily protein